MFENATHNDTTLWEVSAVLDIPADHNEDHRDPYGTTMDRVFTASTAEAAAKWATETFLTQWPNDVRLVSWQLAVFAPYDVDTRTGSGSFIIYSTEIPEVSLAQACEHYDNR